MGILERKLISKQNKTKQIMGILKSSWGFALSSESVTLFLRSVDYKSLGGTQDVVLLIGQSSRKAYLTDVNDCDEFFLINGNGNLNVEFNQKGEKVKECPIPGWIGVGNYIAKDEIHWDLQQGFLEVQKHFGLHEAKLGNIGIYKTLNTQEIIYDYTIDVPGASFCQEYLYAPASGTFQVGMQTTCFWNMPC